MAVEFHIVIPARMASVRLPGKPLLEIGGRSIIEHVWRRAGTAGAASVTIATDSDAIADAARAFGADCELTAADHPSGTDRVAEVARRRNWREQLIVNVQGDEPFMPAAAIRQVVALLADDGEADIATLATPIADDAEADNPNVVKVVADQRGRALLFSRAAIPYRRQPSALPRRRHIGIYGYRADSLRRLVAAPPAELERSEALEQLRALWIGQTIVVADAVETPPPGIDTDADLAAARRLWARRSSD